MNPPSRPTTRPDGRRPDQLRPVSFTLDYVEYPEGSVLIEVGRTRVLCNASVEEQVPAWMVGTGAGYEFRAAMALVTMGGVLISAFFTLVVIPSLYFAFEQMISRLRGQKGFD